LFSFFPSAPSFGLSRRPSRFGSQAVALFTTRNGECWSPEGFASAGAMLTRSPALGNPEAEFTVGTYSAAELHSAKT